jgi:hypothetical protein
MKQRFKPVADQNGGNDIRMWSRQREWARRQE